MKIPVRNREGVTILEPKGAITIGAGDVALRDAVQEALDAGAAKLLINFEKASKMDSSGLGELVAAQQRVTAAGGTLKLLQLPKNVQDVLAVTQIITVFDVFDDEDEAVGSFG